MRILLVHNRYQQYGGEDATYESERELLLAHQHEVRSLIFDNNDIRGLTQKVKAGIQLFYNTASERRMDNAIDDFKPDIIHVHNFFYVASPSIFFSAHKKKIPVVVTLQNYRLICVKGLLMRNSKPCELCVDKIFPLSGVRYSCHRNSMVASAHLTLHTGLHKLFNNWKRKITKYIAVTDFAKNKYVQSSLDFPHEKVVVKPNSVADEAPLPLEARQPYFIFVGRLSVEKGIEVLLNAFYGTDVPLEIIGDGPLRHVVEKAVSKSPNISYSGYRDKAYIISRLKTARAMVFPSVWYECLPVTILEAFSTGTPVIISNIGNLNEIVSDHYNGLHFNPNDATDLREKVQDINRNYHRYQSLYSNARKTFIEKFTHEVNYQNLMNIYKSVIDNYGKPD